MLVVDEDGRRGGLVVVRGVRGGIVRLGDGCDRAVDVHRLDLVVLVLGQDLVHRRGRAESPADDVPHGLEAALARVVAAARLSGEDVAREVAEEGAEDVVDALEDARLGGEERGRGREADEGREEERERGEEEVGDVGDERREEAAREEGVSARPAKEGVRRRERRTHSRTVSPASSTSLVPPDRTSHTAWTRSRR